MYNSGGKDLKFSLRRQEFKFKILFYGAEMRASSRVQTHRHL